MVELIIGAAAGAGVCFFGMWAFLKGRASAGAPDCMTFPRPAGRCGTAPSKDGAESGYEEQIRAMFSEPNEKRGE